MANFHTVRESWHFPINPCQNFWWNVENSLVIHVYINTELIEMHHWLSAKEFEKCIAYKCTFEGYRKMIHLPHSCSRLWTKLKILNFLVSSQQIPVCCQGTPLIPILTFSTCRVIIKALKLYASWKNMDFNQLYFWKIHTNMCLYL